MGRPLKIGSAHESVLLDIVQIDAFSTVREVQAEFVRRTGVDVHTDTLAKALVRLGVERRKGADAVKIEKSKQTERRYGYTARHREQDAQQLFASSLSDHEWALVEDIFAFEGGRGVPPKYPRRQLLDACCYVVRTGCSWRMLPDSFGRWKNVYKTFRRWSALGKFEQMHDRLRADWRERQARAQAPTAAVIDAQSTRISPQGGESGFDAGKKVKGRKRHLVVDTLGLLLAVSVTAASVSDPAGAHPVVARAMSKYPDIKVLYADSAYAGQCAQTVSQLHGVQVQVVRHPANKNVGRWVCPQQGDLFSVQADHNGFVPLPKRWVVERTHAWNERSRRLIMHHDRLSTVSEAWVWLAQARMLLRRVTG